MVHGRDGAIPAGIVCNKSRAALFLKRMFLKVILYKWECTALRVSQYLVDADALIQNFKLNAEEDLQQALSLCILTK